MQPNQGGYAPPPPPGGYPPNFYAPMPGAPAGYPPPQNGGMPMPPQQMGGGPGGYPPTQPSGYPPMQPSGYPQTQAGYPQPYGGAYAPATGGMAPQAPAGGGMPGPTSSGGNGGAAAGAPVDIFGIAAVTKTVPTAPQPSAQQQQPAFDPMNPFDVPRPQQQQQQHASPTNVTQCGGGGSGGMPTGGMMPVMGVPLMGGQQAFGSMPSAGGADAMPPPPAGAIPVRSNHVGGTLENVVCNNIEISDATLVNAHATGAYIRNCNVVGGAFTECTFKSVRFSQVQHLYDSKFDDCTLNPGVVVTRGRLSRTTNNGASLSDCKMK